MSMIIVVVAVLWGISEWINGSWPFEPVIIILTMIPYFYKEEDLKNEYVKKIIKYRNYILWLLIPIVCGILFYKKEKNIENGLFLTCILLNIGAVIIFFLNEKRKKKLEEELNLKIGELDSRVPNKKYEDLQESFSNLKKEHDSCCNSYKSVISKYQTLKNLQLKHEKILKIAGTRIALSKLRTEFPNMKKIALIGLGAVGKTTLIEGLCRIPYTNEETERQDKNAYLHNFSMHKDNYAALIDSSGQVLTIQQDISVEADIIVFLLDHNAQITEILIDEERLNRQKSFLKEIEERFITSESTKFPEYFLCLLNKYDVWQQLANNKATEFESTCRASFDEFEQNLRSYASTKGIQIGQNNFIFERFIAREEGHLTSFQKRIEQILEE